MSLLDLQPSSLPPLPLPPGSPRESILREMRESLAAEGGAWVLSGPSGIGKTYLARRLQAELAPTVQMVWARGTAWGKPFQPLREAAESLRLWPLEEPALPGELAGVPAEVRERETWISLFQRRGQDGPPLVLCCDDLDSFDAPSWECVREMLRRRECFPVSLLLLVRPGPSRLALDGLPEELRIEVPPLTLEELAACCQERLGGVIGFEALFPWLLKASGGNPRHLLEILHYLRDTERLVPAAAGWRRNPESSLDAPCFEELVRRRLEAALVRERPEVRSWIERGAVLGSRLEVPPAVAPALERVGARTGYLERAEERPDSFRFADQRVRKAVRVLCEDRRPTLDEGDPRLAGLLEEEGKWRQAAEEAAVALNNLALVAAALGDRERAGELLVRARSVAADVETDLWVRCNLAMVRATLGSPGVAADHLRHLAVEAGRSSPQVRQAILFNLARALLEAGQAAEALAAATVPPPCPPGDEELARHALASLRLQAVRQGRVGRPERGLLLQSRRLEDSTRPQAWLYRTLWARGDLLFL